MEKDIFAHQQYQEFMESWTRGTVTNGQLFELPVLALQPDPNQPRKTLHASANHPDLCELSASIQEHGILEPVLFRAVPSQEADKSPTLYIVAGSRRWLAAQMSGLETIPARYFEGNEIELGLSENLIRQDLTAIEEAEAMRNWLDQKGMKQIDLAKKLGKSVATVNESLAILNLPQEILDDCRADHSLSKSMLLRLSKMKNQEKVLEALQKIRGKASGTTSATDTEKPPKKGTVDYFCAKILKLLEEVSNFDAGKWKPEERTTLIQTFENAIAQAKAHMQLPEEAR